MSQVANRGMRDEYAWADYLIYMEAGAEMPLPVETPKPRPLWPGVLATAGMAGVAYSLVGSGLLPKGTAEPVTIALPLGIALGNMLGIDERLKTGVRYAGKTILTVGIILLGARLNFADVVQVGVPALVLSALQVGLMLVLAVLAQRWLGIGHKQATLLGIGTAICGGSAVIATGPVIEAEERDVAFAVATVSFLGLMAMFVLPLLGHGLGMTDTAFGVWAGLAIQQTPQVVAAGLAYSPEAGQAATLVKLARVCLLAPVVLGVSYVYRRRHAEAKKRSWKMGDVIPPVALGFVVLAVVHTAGMIPMVEFRFPERGTVPVDVLAVMKWLSGFAITMGMAAVGLETSLRSLKAIGVRPIAAGVLLAVAAVAFSFGAVRMAGI